MIAVTIICLITCFLIILSAIFKPRIKLMTFSINTYWLISLIGAAVLILLNFISLTEINKNLFSNNQMNPIKILILFLSMTILSVFLDETGFFKYLANVIVKRCSTSQLKLFNGLFIVISILTIFTSNDIIILTFTPFICYFSKNAKVNPIPYLILEFVCANTSSMLLIIGNPTNIYLASSIDITFIEYLEVMWLPTIFSVITTYVILLVLFRTELRKKISINRNNIKVEDRLSLIIGLLILLTCTILLVISSYINIAMWLISLSGVLLLLLTIGTIKLLKKEKISILINTLRRTPVTLIPFVISMFILVLTLDKYDITSKIATFLTNGNMIYSYGFTSALFANLINNIPMSILFSYLTNLSVKGGTSIVYASIIGSNLGAYLTPIGALAGIMWLQILRENKIEFSFVKFCKYGIIICLPTLLMALLALSIITN